MVIQTEHGYPEVILGATGTIDLFHKTADWLRQNIGIAFERKTEEGESLTWLFQFADVTMALRYMAAAGITLCPATLAHASDEERAAFKILIEILRYQ